MRGVCAALCLLVPALASAQEAPPVEAGLAIDWSTGPTFGDAPTVGGAHGFGVEGQLAALGLLELDGRYELLAIALPNDEGTTASHQLLGQLKLRWITDAARRQLWTIGGGYGTAFRPTSLGGRAALARIAIARQIGIPTSHWNTAFELAYEHSLDDDSLDLVLGSIRLGYMSGALARYEGAKTPLFTHTTSFDAFFPWGAGMTFGLHANRYLSLETSGSFNADLTIESTDANHHGFDGAQWVVQTGPRLQLDSWPLFWAPLYMQVQAGIGWIARDPGELRPIQTGELGIRIVCSSFGADVGGWIRTEVADGSLRALTGGLVLRIVLATDRNIIGGHNRGCADDHGGSSAGTTTHTATVSSEGGLSLPTIPTLPAPRIEQVGTKLGFIWIAGHWEWRDGTWAWIGGRWEAERPNMRWLPGHYEVRGSIHVWIEGRWAPR